MPLPPHKPLHALDAFPCCPSFPSCPIFIEARTRASEDRAATSATEAVAAAHSALQDTLATYHRTWTAAEALQSAIHARRAALPCQAMRPIDPDELELRHALEDELRELWRREAEDHARGIALQALCEAYGPSISATREALQTATRADLLVGAERVEGANEVLFGRHGVVARLEADQRIRRQRHHAAGKALRGPGEADLGCEYGGEVVELEMESWADGFDTTGSVERGPKRRAPGLNTTIVNRSTGKDGIGKKRPADIELKRLRGAA
ncbi:hypothetical protein MMC13_004480 [Lambiella insularis]|nr:hypothetical protein [Lambiella insularis]